MFFSNKLTVGSQVSEQVGPLLSSRLKHSQSTAGRSYIYSITCAVETFWESFQPNILFSLSIWEKKILDTVVLLY